MSVGVGIGVCKGCGTAGAVLASPPLYNFHSLELYFQPLSHCRRFFVSISTLVALRLSHRT